MGVGLGYTFDEGSSNDITEIDTTSVRFRFLNGITVEPTVMLSLGNDSVDQGFGDSDTTTVNVGLGADVRFPIASWGPVDFVVLGGAGIGYQRVDPDGDNNNTTTTGITGRWGLAVEYWVTPRWLINMTGRNPFFDFASSDQPGGAETTSIDFGIIFDPTITAMVHLIFG